MKAIMAAYGDAWEKVKEYLDKDGWCCGIHPIKAGWPEDYDWNQGCWRPKSLSGIEDNNGWIRCSDQMPAEERQYYIVIDGTICRSSLFKSVAEYIPGVGHAHITHWKPTDPPKPPIY